MNQAKSNKPNISVKHIIKIKIQRCMMMYVLYTMEEAEKKIQDHINEIIKDCDHANFDKLPGLIEALKIIMENKD